jgi:hypothetical protein
MGVPNPAIAQTPPTGDRANAVVFGAFAVGNIAGANAFSGLFSPWGPFNLTAWGPNPPNGAWVGSLQLERQLDGLDWIVCGLGGAGQQAIWTTGTDLSIVFGEPELGVAYRLHCTALTGGPLNYRLSQSGGAAMSLANPSPV